MNITLQNLTLENFQGATYGTGDNCIYTHFGEILINTSCIKKNVCTQLSDYIIYNGIGVIIAYFLFITLITWYFRVGYKQFKMPFLKTYSFKERLIYYNMIHHWVNVAMITYICSVVIVYGFF